MKHGPVLPLLALAATTLIWPYSRSAAVAPTPAIGISGSPVQKWRIEPGNVTVCNPLSGSKVTRRMCGKFQLLPDPQDGERSIIGGGCLIVQDPNQIRQCTDDSVCRPGYCADQTCWHKPVGEDPCKRGLTLQQGVPIRLSAKLNTNLRWRVITCQSLVSGGCSASNPAGKKYRFGEIWEPR
jgi:hypothetical protein